MATLPPAHNPEHFSPIDEAVATLRQGHVLESRGLIPAASVKYATWVDPELLDEATQRLAEELQEAAAVETVRLGSTPALQNKYETLYYPFIDPTLLDKATQRLAEERQKIPV